MVWIDIPKTLLNIKLRGGYFHFIVLSHLKIADMVCCEGCQQCRPWTSITAGGETTDSRGETGDADINGFYPSQNNASHNLKALPDAGTASKHINSFQTLR